MFHAFWRIGQATQTRNLEQQDWFPPRLHWIFRGSRKCLALPLSLLQKRWRWVLQSCFSLKHVFLFYFCFHIWYVFLLLSFSPCEFRIRTKITVIIWGFSIRERTLDLQPAFSRARRVCQCPHSQNDPGAFHLSSQMIRDAITQTKRGRREIPLPQLSYELLYSLFSMKYMILFQYNVFWYRLQCLVWKTLRMWLSCGFYNLGNGCPWLRGAPGGGWCWRINVKQSRRLVSEFASQGSA